MADNLERVPTVAEKTLRILEEGQGEYSLPDPDVFREWTARKDRAMRPKLMTAQEAVARFVADGDYIVWETNYFQRGPSALIREIIRQRKTRLWAGGKFTWVIVALLVEAGCCDRADMGFFVGGPGVTRAVVEKRLKVYEYSNLVMAARLRAGAMGLSFISVRSLGGTDGFKYSGAKIIEDPYTGKPTVIVPALYPDVALIHVHQADQYGNARIFGTTITDVESALASRKVIISAEEIINTEEIRHKPGLTKIPYYLVDAVVHQPFGAYPGECPGMYASDTEHVAEVLGAIYNDKVKEYLDKWVYSVASEEQMLVERVGLNKLKEMQRRATMVATEGYRS